ncbi:TetR/AcrR family transcriptional regulator [Acetobacteraceae bacterium]|nr:TetR/AcrR family transcriptional regulator [Acetobacteraceae bacterium]
MLSVLELCPIHSADDGIPASKENLKERREKIFDTACALLQKGGYTELSVECLARKACMSKKTIYQIFESKEILLFELLQERLFIPMKFQPLSTPMTLAEELTELMRQLYEHCIHPRNLALLRLLIGESERSATVEQILSELIHRSDKESPLHSFLLEKREKGLLDFPDLEETSSRLFGLVLGAPFISHLLKCVQKEKDAAWTDRFIREGVRVFLAGYGTR